MERSNTEDGQLFIKSLASFIRQHEKALANSLQFSVAKRQSATSASTTSLSSLASPTTPINTAPTSNSLATALSFAGLNFMANSVRPAHLTLTPHHLFYLLSRLEDLDISVGPMSVRLENIHSDASPANYVSFLHQPTKPPVRGRSDKESIHSVSSVRSVMSGMSVFWSSIGLGSSSKSDKAKAAMEADLKYLYSAFTKLPSLRLSPDHRARLIRGFEEFPFDTAVPLFAFKNVQQLDIVDVDFRSFYGWDRLADQLTLLTVKRANLDDPMDLITNIVLDDAEKRRRRSPKGGHPSPTLAWNVPSPTRAVLPHSNSDPGSSSGASPRRASVGGDETSFQHSTESERGDQSPDMRTRSISPNRPSNSRPTSSYKQVRAYSSKARRSGSGSSNSSEYSLAPQRSESCFNLLTMSVLPPSKWQRLKYLSLADNSLTTLSTESLLPLANTLRSLNLSSNLFTEVPDSLASLTRLSSLDLSNCMIESLHSLERNPLPAILTIKLKSNRLQSLAGVERLLSLENLNVQDNKLSDPTEAARLTGIPNLQRIWVKHNPFTKRHADFRVTIFNLFRTTPGYTEDIIIDDMGPGYTERKQLVDRVPEMERPPVLRAMEAPVPPPIILQDPIAFHESRGGKRPQEMRPQPYTAQTDPGLSSTRRKKSTRRRIVDLASEDSSGVPLILAPSKEPGPKIVLAPANGLGLATPMIPQHPEIEKTSRSERSDGMPKKDAVPDQGDHLARTLNSDAYRQEMAAMRQQFGSNWISVYSDRGWDGPKNIMTNGNVDLPSAIPSMHRANSHAIVSGGRTLG